MKGSVSPSADPAVIQHLTIQKRGRGGFHMLDLSLSSMQLANEVSVHGCASWISHLLFVHLFCTFNSFARSWASSPKHLGCIYPWSSCAMQGSLKLFLPSFLSRNAAPPLHSWISFRGKAECGGGEAAAWAQVPPGTCAPLLRNKPQTLNPQSLEISTPKDQSSPLWS